MVFIFLSIIVTMIIGATSTDQIVVGAALENSDRNAPYVIQNFYTMMALLTCLMTTAFVNDAASRDFAYNTNQLLFGKPIDKLSFLMGRFWGAVTIALIPVLGVSIGVILSPMMPWNDDPSRFGAIHWPAHFWGLAAFAIPNVIFIAAFIFAIAIWMRSTFTSFIGVILLIMFYGITQSLIGNLDNETFAQLADPFGIVAFQTQTKYWTVSDRNTLALTLGSPMLLYNRLIWLGIGLTILAAACWRFSFAERKTRAKKIAISIESSTAVSIPSVSFKHGIGTSISQLVNQFKIDFWSTVKSPVFLVIIIAGMLDTFFSLRTVATEGFGLSALPVTYTMIDIIRGGLYVYLLTIIIFYAGVLVWKERDAKMDEVFDAMPHSTWIPYVAKLFTLLAIVLIVLSAETLMGVVNQAMAGYTRFQLDVYFYELFMISFVWIFCFIVISLLIHVISPNKYIGYFAIAIFAIANLFTWPWLGIESNLLRFTSLPSYTYSDMFSFQPFSSGLAWFGSYWVLFVILLSCFAILLWQRGRDRGISKRLPLAFHRLNGSMGLATTAIFAIWACVGGWTYCNTQVLNHYDTSDEVETLQVKYENEFSSLLELPQPRIIQIKHDIDLYPAERKLIFKGDQTLINPHEEPIDTIVLNLTDGFETTVEIQNATLQEDHEDVMLQIYKLERPLQPGEQLNMKYVASYEPQGFENSISQLSIVQNGSFFNSGIAPQIGYQKGKQITDEDDREEHGLEKMDSMPEFDPTNLAARRNTYLSDSSDWLDVETIISTSNDQIAIAPGSLVKKWEKDGRRYFHYKVDHKSLNFYSFISADYKVQLREWNGVDIEVYYHEDHAWNVDKMLRSIRKSLEYYTANFGPYKHKQARIIEFPRTATFAQAFPGTMPYSEGIGFIADIKEDDDIDMVYYVVAHEMAHQWWAHQVIGANMLGATMLSETLAQYSALMVMEKEYGRDIMRKFLKHEMNSYLSARGREMLKERPLREVAAQQGYIHYNKGSVAMYYLKEMIGEDRVNTALKSLIDRFAYKAHPYPTSQDLIDALAEQTPAELQYLLDDLFEKITLFENRTLATTYRELPDGKYEVSIEVECKKIQADEDGVQSDVAVNDWIEIGAFAKPDDGKQYGETLHRQRVHITKPKNEFTFTVNQPPALAGVDPFLLLIDRMPDDNLKKPTLED